MMLMASPLICKLNPLPPNRRRTPRVLLPGPTGAGFRSFTGAGTARPKDYWKSLAPCPLWCPHHLRGDALANWHRFGVQSGGAPSGRSPSASVQLPRVPILAACALSPDPRQTGGSRTFRLTHAQPDTCITKSPANSKPRRKVLDTLRRWRHGGGIRQRGTP